MIKRSKEKAWTDSGEEVKKKFHWAIKSMTKLRQNILKKIKDEKGNLVTDGDKMMDIWKRDALKRRQHDDEGNDTIEDRNNMRKKWWYSNGSINMTLKVYETKGRENSTENVERWIEKCNWYKREKWEQAKNFQGQEKLERFLKEKKEEVT